MKTKFEVEKWLLAKDLYSYVAYKVTKKRWWSRTERQTLGAFPTFDEARDAMRDAAGFPKLQSLSEYTATGEPIIYGWW
jgi:hypothetical protein